MLLEIHRMAVTYHGANVVLRGLIAAAIQYARYQCEARYWLMTRKPTFSMALLRHCSLRLDPLQFTLADPTMAERHPAYCNEPPVPQAWKGEREAGDVALEWLMRSMG